MTIPTPPVVTGSIPRDPMLHVQALLAAAQVLVAGSVLGDLVGAKWAALAALVVAAAQAGFAIVSRAVPASAVIAATSTAGHPVAGDAAPALTGTPVHLVREGEHESLYRGGDARRLTGPCCNANRPHLRRGGAVSPFTPAARRSTNPPTRDRPVTVPLLADLRIRRSRDRL